MATGELAQARGAVGQELCPGLAAAWRPHYKPWPMLGRTQPKNDSTARSRALGLWLACLALLGHALQVAHVLGHRHVYCAEHGQIEHAHAAHDHCCDHGADARGSDCSGDHDGDDHEACPYPHLGLVPDGPALPTAPQPLDWARLSAIPAPSSEHVPPLCPLELAPSRSPPAA